jgi:hypothetical protein
MCILGYIALEIGTSACLMMQSQAFGKQRPNPNDAFSAQQPKKWVENFTSCKLQCRSTKKLSAVGTPGYSTVLTTCHTDLWKKLHYDDGIFIQKLYAVLKIFTIEGSHSNSWFKSGGPVSCIWILATNMSIQWWWYGPEKRNRDERASAIAESFVIQAWEGLERQFHGYLDLLSPIRVAERFRPLPMIKGIA